jgi:hypothetical protein
MDASIPHRPAWSRCSARESSGRARIPVLHWHSAHPCLALAERASVAYRLSSIFVACAGEWRLARTTCVGEWRLARTKQTPAEWPTPANPHQPPYRGPPYLVKAASMRRQHAESRATAAPRSPPPGAAGRGRVVAARPREARGRVRTQRVRDLGGRGDSVLTSRRSPRQPWQGHRPQPSQP